MEVSACIPQFFKIYDNIVIFGGHHVTAKTHCHHALELIISFDTGATLHTDEGTMEGHGFLLKQDYVDSTTCDGYAIFICISPESILGKRLTFALGRHHVLVIKQKTLAKIKSYISDLITHDHSENEIASYITRALIPDIAKVEKNYTVDLRIAKVLDFINNNVQKSFQFQTLTEIACLSPSRLSHLFKTEVGISIRKYILWSRLQRANKHFLRGNTLTQSAHLAGFSDVAHFTRTFVSTFGMSPSQLLKTFNG